MDSNNINNEIKNELNSEVAEKKSSQKQSKPEQFRRRLLVVFSIIISLIIIGGVIWLVLDKNSSKQTSDKSGGMSLTDIYHRALEVNQGGDYQQAQKILDEALEKDNTQETKTFILSAKTGMALNQEKYQEAYDLATELNKIRPGFNSYQLLAKASLGLGNKDQALQYFKATLDTVKGDDEFAEYDRNWLQEEISKIEGGFHEN